MKQSNLVGKIIESIEMTSDQKAIKFKTTNGEVIAKVDGDCCSSTWIENIELPALGFPAKIISVDNLDMPDQGSPDEYTLIQYYGCKITTDKGELIIDYRNESNGYYGGTLVWPEDTYFYGGVFGQNVDNGDWKPLGE